jgi:hypothetical protein
MRRDRVEIEGGKLRWAVPRRKGAALPLRTLRELVLPDLQRVAGFGGLAGRAESL